MLSYILGVNLLQFDLYINGSRKGENNDRNETMIGITEWKSAFGGVHELIINHHAFINNNHCLLNYVLALLEIYVKTVATKSYFLSRYSYIGVENRINLEKVHSAPPMLPLNMYL